MWNTLPSSSTKSCVYYAHLRLINLFIKRKTFMVNEVYYSNIYQVFLDNRHLLDIIDTDKKVKEKRICSDKGFVWKY